MPDASAACLNGHPMPTGAKFCQECGAPASVPSTPPPGQQEVLPTEEVVEQSPEGRKRPKARWIIGAVVLLLCLAGGGAAIAASHSGSNTSHSAAGASSAADVTACKGDIGDFVTALQEINSRLDVGLNVSEMSERLGDAKVAYDKVNTTAAAADCGPVAVAAEGAYNAYLGSIEDWQSCIQDAEYCTAPTGGMQKKWAKAAVLLQGIQATFE